MDGLTAAMRDWVHQFDTGFAPLVTSMEHEKHRIEKMRKDTQRRGGARRRQDKQRWEEAERREGGWQWEDTKRRREDEQGRVNARRREEPKHRRPHH